VEETVERVVDVVALGSDAAEHGLELVGVVQVQDLGLDAHKLSSMPS
jgi:hypothetical protein